MTKGAKKGKRGQCSVDKTNVPQHERIFLDSDVFSGRLQQNMRPSLLDDIEKFLYPADWQRVLDSPFGSIVKAVRAQAFSSQMVHYMLFRQVKTAKKWETWYDIQGQLLRFSMKEFAMITGLKCHKIQSRDTIEDKNSMIQMFGEQKMSVEQLRLKMYSLDKDNPMKYRAALLLILEAFILGIDNKVLVNSAHVKLLQDIDRFFNFPWGRVAYVTTHDGLATALPKRMMSLNESTDHGSRAGYKLKRLPISFQLWLYEAIPSLASAFAEISNPRAYPRWLRWSSLATPTFEEVRVILDKDPSSQSAIKINTTLSEDESELGLLEGCKFDEEVKDLLFDQVVKKLEERKKVTTSRKKSDNGKALDGNREVMCALNEIVSRLINLENKMEAVHKALRISDPVEDKSDDEEVDLDEAMDDHELGRVSSPLQFEKEGNDEGNDVVMENELEGTSSPLACDTNNIIADDKGEGDDKGNDVATEHGLEGTSPHLERDSNNIPATDKGEGDDEGNYVATEHGLEGTSPPLERDSNVIATNDEEEVMGDKSDEQEKELVLEVPQASEASSKIRRIVFKSSRVQKNETETEHEGPIEGVRTRSKGSKNENVEDRRPPSQRLKKKNKQIDSATWEKSKRAKVSTSVSSPLFAWLDSNEGDEFEIACGTLVKRDFFRTLAEPRKWLSDLHIEECLHLLRPRARKDAVILDPYFCHNLDKEMRRWHAQKEEYIPDEIKMKYLSGKLPVDNGKDWKSVKHVYLPFLLNKKHWVALEIDLEVGTVFVLDSDVHVIKISDLHVFLRELVNMLPVLMSYHEPLAEFTKRWGTRPFNLARNPTLPKNNKGGDCVVYTIKYIEFKSSGRQKISDVSDKHVDAYRMMMARSIFEKK